MIDRIKQVIDYSQMSSSAFADTIGISRSGMTHLLTGRNQPSLDVARKILAKFPEISTEWLIMGMGEMLRPEEQPQQPVVNTEAEVAPVQKTAPESYPDENSKIGTQFDLFGEYVNSDEPQEDVVASELDTVASETMEQPDDEQNIVEEEPKMVVEPESQSEEVVPEVVAAPVVAPAKPARVPATPVRTRKASAEARSASVSAPAPTPTPVPTPVRRERHTPAPPQEKKLQKIVFFYDDHSFEVYNG